MGAVDTLMTGNCIARLLISFFACLAKPLGPFKTAQDAVYLVLMLVAAVCFAVSLVYMNPLSAVICVALAGLSWHTLLVHTDRARLKKSLAKAQEELETTETKLKRVEAQLLASPAVSPQSVPAEWPLPPPRKCTDGSNGSDSTHAGDSPVAADLKEGDFNIASIKPVELGDIMPEGLKPDSVLIEVHKEDFVKPHVSPYARMHSMSMDGTEMSHDGCHGLSHKDGLQLLMEHPETGQQKTFNFTKRPMGIQFWQSLPLCLTTVEGHALDLGVEQGWFVREFGEHDVSKFSTFQEAYEQFTKSAGQLPQNLN